MSGCLDCGMPTQKRRCQTCRVEHNAPGVDDHDQDEYECPDCGGVTYIQDEPCHQCRRADDIVGDFKEVDA
jgi:predicted RNA-binding Zn-ribbon protein involved in translation (DUF1610 family)